MLAHLLVFCHSLAAAQGFDALGPQAPPDSGDAADAPWTLGFGTPRGGVSLGAEWQEQTLVRTFPDGSSEAALDDLLSAKLALLSPSLWRVQLGATIPTVLASTGEVNGASVSDLRLWVPVTVLDEAQGAVRITPLLRVPTGNPDRFSGDPGLGGGGLVSGHGRVGPLVAGTDLGVEAGAATGVDEWPGGTMLLAAATVGVVPVEALGVHLGWRSRSPVAADRFPSELGAAAKLGLPMGGFATLGGSRALTRGIGATALRAEFAVGFSPPVPEEPELVPVVEVPEDRIEVLTLTTPEGGAVRGAEVRMGEGIAATTDAYGRVDVPAEAVGPVRVDHPGFVPAEVALEGEGTELAIALERPPVPVAVRFIGADGQPLTKAPAIDPPPATPLVVDDVGTWHGTLPPGTYTVTSTAEGLGTQTRTVVVASGRTEILEVDAVLQPSGGDGALTVRIVDPLGRPVEAARVALGGVPMGATASGGDLVIASLATTPVELVVTADPWAAPATMTLTPGPNAVAELVAGWPDGAAIVRAAGPDGVVTDALVAFRGPSGLPPAPLGADGERMFTLRPGAWSVLVSSTTLGAQERRFVIDEGVTEAVIVQVVLQAGEGGDADLTVQVVGPEGPVAHAEVGLDGKPLGLTGPDGTLRALGLKQGPRELAVTSELLRPWQGEVELFGGGQAIDVPVRWAPGAVEVVALDPEQVPVDAAIAFRGPVQRPVEHLGRDGLARMALGSGQWDLAISSPAWGTQVRRLTVNPDDDMLRRIRVRLLPPDDAGGGLSLTVRDPDGQPVHGAEVTLAGQPVGTTTDGFLEARSLPRTTTELTVSAEAMGAVVRRVRVSEDTPVEVDLAWAPGALRVDVVGPEGPADVLLAASGPVPARPRRTGTDGTVVMGLAPGTWRMLASSQSLGAAEADAQLPEEPGLSALTITLEPPGVDMADTAILLLRVRDLDGEAVAGAEVTVGSAVQTTSQGGSALVSGLPPGALKVSIDGGLAFDPRTLQLDLAAGSHQRIVVVQRRVRSVVVKAVDAAGKPVSARILAEGPTSAAAEAGANGTAKLGLVPGRWTLTARSEAGVATEDLTVEPGEVALEVELVVKRTESRIEDGVVVLGRPVPFDLDSDVLRADAEPLLDDVARLLRAETSILRVEVQGHTDDSGEVAYNQDLSERRARSVLEALIARGIDTERLTSIGYGLMRPLEPGTDEASRAMNRRVEIIVVERSGGG